MVEINVLDMPYSRAEKKEYQLEQIVKLIEQGSGVARTRDIEALGVDYRRVETFVKEGSLRRLKNGYYTTPGGEYTEEQLFTTLFPEGVLTMETALYYHGYLKQRPYGWYVAISKNTSKSRFSLEYPIVTPYYTEEAVLSLGVENITICGKEMKIYDIDRLICDVLKYEEKMDRQDFREAALCYIRDDRKNVLNLMEYARERKVLHKVQTMIGVWL